MAHFFKGEVDWKCWFSMIFHDFWSPLAMDLFWKRRHWTENVGICRQLRIRQPSFIPVLQGIRQSLSIFLWNVKRFLIEFVWEECGRGYTHSVHYTNSSFSVHLSFDNVRLHSVPFSSFFSPLIVWKRAPAQPSFLERGRLCRRTFSKKEWTENVDFQWFFMIFYLGELRE